MEHAVEAPLPPLFAPAALWQLLFVRDGSVRGPYLGLLIAKTIPAERVQTRSAAKFLIQDLFTSGENYMRLASSKRRRIYRRTVRENGLFQRTVEATDGTQTDVKETPYILWDQNHR